MAVNRFDQPVESEYISQYTPIPFELLYAIGKANNERVDKAYSELGNQFSKWAEFRSPSAVDTLRWYDLTIGAGQDIVNLLATNPDLIKTAEGRSKIQSFINSRPYTELSSLQLSREGMLQRLLINLKLAAEGKFNPLWHDVDFTNYDTRNGIFNDISPLAYKSEVDLVEPYVNNLKSAFIELKGAYDWRGVSEARTDEELSKNISAIYNTPEALKHLLVLQRLGYSPQEAQLIFTDRIYRAGREFAYRDREINPLFKLGYEYNLKERLKGQEQALQAPGRLTQSIAASGMEAFKIGAVGYVSDRNRNALNLLLQLKQQAIASGDTLTVNVVNTEINNLRNKANSYTPQTLFRDIFNEFSDNGKLNNIQLSNATNNILNQFALPLKNAKVNQLLVETIPGVTTENVKTDFGNSKIISDGRNLDLAEDVISGIAGYKHTPSPKDKFRDALKNGKINNMIIRSANHVLTLPTNQGGVEKPYSAQVITVSIPADQLRALGISDNDMKIAGARKEYSPTKSSSTTLSGDMKENSNLPEYIKAGDSKYSHKVPQREEYYLIDLLNNIPNPEDRINAEYLDQEAWKLSMSDSDRAELFPRVQQQAYSISQ